ncbi:hypothetical protein C8R45DRAFT_1215191, partial [Mycena sanguinolenta]
MGWDGMGELQSRRALDHLFARTLLAVYPRPPSILPAVVTRFLVAGAASRHLSNLLDVPRALRLPGCPRCRPSLAPARRDVSSLGALPTPRHPAAAAMPSPPPSH